MAERPWQTGRVISQAVEEFEAQRPRLFGIAYRMLGEAAEAEDVVQDAYLRWAAADYTTTVAPAWLSKVVVNLCLNRLTSCPDGSSAPSGTASTHVRGWPCWPTMRRGSRRSGTIDPGQEQADRVTVTLTSATTARHQGDEPLRIETVYDAERARLKVIVLGGIDDSAALLKLIAAVIEARA